MSDWRLRSPAPERTDQIARALGGCIGPAGATLELIGGLGTGKTHFVKGLGTGLGLDPSAITSPTFVISSEYPLPEPLRGLAHVDFYRIEGEAELEATGFLDLLAVGMVVAVEWGDRFPNALPTDRLRIELRRGADPEEREITVGAGGEGSKALLGLWRERAEAADS